MTVPRFHIALGVLASFLMLSGRPASAQALTNIPAAFTDVGIGAEAAALGYAGVAGVRGSDALAWNPASIVPRDGMELSFSWVDQLGLVDFGYMAWSMPLRSGRSALGASVEVSGDDMLLETTLRTAYSHRIRRVHVGIGLGYRRADYGRNRLSADDYLVFDPDEVASGIQQQVSGSANGLLLDAGLHIEASRRIDVAVSARNVLAPMSWVSRSAARSGSRTYIESVPMEVTTGMAYRLSDKLGGFMSWTPSLGSDAIPRVGLGASFTPVTVLTLRAGRLMIQDRSGEAWKTFGFGLRTPTARDWAVMADYAYVVSPLARTQQITLRFAW
jgi:hypothetical protein